MVAKSKVAMELRADMATATIEALVVPDHVQQVPIIVGQPFVNNESVTVVLRGKQLQLFNHDKMALPEIDELLSRKVNLYVQDTTIIPPNHVGHIIVQCNEDVNDVFIDSQQRNWPENFHIIPACIINMENYQLLPIIEYVR